jgi:Phytanoyl-CoA dioxygenase (PhyH)
MAASTSLQTQNEVTQQTRRRPGALRSPLLVRTIRQRPTLYSAICKARLFYSRRIAGAEARRKFHSSLPLFRMNEFEAQQIASLRNLGYAVAPRFFSAEIVKRIYARADFMFRDCQVELRRAYSVQDGQRESLEGLSYEQLSATEKMISVRDPLLHIPELLDLAFHESILKIAANFLGSVPPLYRVMVVRDFPHSRALHSSNFHKDNDESDSLQIFIYLVDIDDHCGPLIYVPGSNRYDVRSCRPRLSRDLGIDTNDGRLSDEEVERAYPRDSWIALHTGCGSIAAIHGNGIHKGPAWARPGDPANRPRTAIRLDLHGQKSGVVRDGKENRIRKSDFARMSPLQRLFAHPSIVDDASIQPSQRESLVGA